MNTVFNELDHRLSVVKRWGLLHTIQTQSVAEHAFNVARIAERIAVDWFEISPKSNTMLDVMRYAIHHDDLEALSLDLPTMIKPYFDEARFADDHRDLVDVPKPVEYVKNIVKLADMIEGYHFLCMEVKLGNSYVYNHLNHEPSRITEWYMRAFMPNPSIKVRNKIEATLNNMGDQLSSRFSRRGA